MRKALANFGCYSAIALFLIGSFAALIRSSGGRTFLGIIFGIIGLFVIVCMPHNLRIRRVRKVVRNLPKIVKEQVLDLIGEAAAKNPSITFLLLDDSPCSQLETSILSHVGGIPYAERDLARSLRFDSASFPPSSSP
jgi:hypothetical protein